MRSPRAFERLYLCLDNPTAALQTHMSQGVSGTLVPFARQMLFEGQTTMHDRLQAPSVKATLRSSVNLLSDSTSHPAQVPRQVCRDHKLLCSGTQVRPFPQVGSDVCSRCLHDHATIMSIDPGCLASSCPVPCRSRRSCCGHSLPEVGRTVSWRCSPGSDRPDLSGAPCLASAKI